MSFYKAILTTSWRQSYHPEFCRLPSICVESAKMEELSTFTDLNISHENIDLLENETITAEDNNPYKGIIDKLQFSMTNIGFLGNVIVYITLSKNGHMFTSPTMLSLLKKSKCSWFYSLSYWEYICNAATNVDNFKWEVKCILLHGRYFIFYYILLSTSLQPVNGPYYPM